MTAAPYSLDKRYRLRGNDTLLAHFPRRQPCLQVRDIDASAEILAQARARSGDYLPTLATELDKLAQSLAAAQAPEASELERLVSELLYIDQNFELRRK